MKAFCNLEAAKNELHHYDLVCRSMYALLPLRDDRRKTEEYFNRYLFADARLHGVSDGALWEDEVNPALAPAVRLEILKVISVDDSFEMARDIITRSDHRYHEPDDYNSILHDPPAPEQYSEQDWQIKAYNLGMEILNVISVREKVKELVDITLKIGVNGTNKSFPIQELTKLETALLECGKCNTALKEQIAELEGEVERLRKELNGEEAGEVMTVMQLALFAVYLFGEMGLHFDNSEKTEWARLLHRMTGKSEQRIRNALNFDFDNRNVKQNLRIIAAWCSELFPHIAEKMVKDMKN